MDDLWNPGIAVLQTMLGSAILEGNAAGVVMMNSSRTGLGVSLLVLLGLLLPASGVFGQQVIPEEIVMRYYDSLLHGNFEEAYALLSSEDREHASLDEYVDLMMSMGGTAGLLIEMQHQFPRLHRYVEDNLLRVVPLATDEKPGRVEMEAEIHYLNIFVLLFEIGDVEPAFNDPDQPTEELDEAAMQAVEALYGEDGPPVHVDVAQLTIVEEDGRWRLFVGVEQQIRAVRSEELGAEAWNASFDGNLTLARDLYLEALELNPENNRFREALEQIEVKLRDLEEQISAQPEPYVTEFIEVWDIRIEEGVFPDVVFSIRNNGDRLVDDLRVRMVYRSAEGSIMAVELGRIDRYNMAFYPGHDYENERWSPWQVPFDWDMENFEFTILEALGPVADER